MARTSLSEADIAAFRARATAAAARLFAAHGYDGVTMRALAAELGCSPMTPYRYLENKDELFALVRTDAFTRFGDRQRTAARDPSEDAAGCAPDPLARLLRLERAYIQFALDDPDAYRVMFELRQPQTARYPALAAASKRAFRFLRDAVAAAVDAGCLTGDPLTLAHVLWANTHGLVSLHLAGKLVMGRSLDQLASLSLGLGALPPS